MRSEGYGTWFVSVSVCLSVCYHIFCDYAQRDNKTAIPMGSYTGFILKWWFSYSYYVQKLWREQANMQISTGLPRPRPLTLCILKAKESQRIDPRMLSTTVASPCQTLRELLYSWRPSVSGTMHAQFAEHLHFSAFHSSCITCLPCKPRFLGWPSSHVCSEGCSTWSVCVCQFIGCLQLFQHYRLRGGL